MCPPCRGPAIHHILLYSVTFQVRCHAIARRATCPCVLPVAPCPGSMLRAQAHAPVRAPSRLAGISAAGAIAGYYTDASNVAQYRYHDAAEAFQKVIAIDDDDHGEHLVQRGEFRGLGHVAEIARVDDELGRLGQRIDLVHGGLQRSHHVRIGRLVEPDMAVADLHESHLALGLARVCRFGECARAENADDDGPDYACSSPGHAFEESPAVDSVVVVVVKSEFGHGPLFRFSVCRFYQPSRHAPHRQSFATVNFSQKQLASAGQQSNESWCAATRRRKEFQNDERRDTAAENTAAGAEQGAQVAPEPAASKKIPAQTGAHPRPSPAPNQPPAKSRLPACQTSRPRRRPPGSLAGKHPDRKSTRL